MTTKRFLSAAALFILVGLHVVASWLFLPQLRFHADLSVDSDVNREVKKSLSREKAFPTANPLVFLTSDSPTRDWLAELLGRQELTVRTAKGNQTELSPLERRLFRTHEGNQWVVYVPTRGDGRKEAALVEQTLIGQPSANLAKVVIGGGPWVQHLLDKALAVNLAWLMPGALLVLGLVFAAMTKSASSTFLLTGLSCLPALGIILLFPVLGLPFDYTTILAPLLTLALATTYTVHIHHHLQLYGPDWRTLIEHRGQAVFWSASISALGFSSLWTSPLPSLRFLATLLVVGLGFTLFWVLIALPLFFKIVPGRRHPSPPLLLGHPTRASRWTLATLGGLALFGLGSLSMALHWSDYLKSDSQEGQVLAHFEQAFPTWNEVSLHLAWPEEGGWLEADRWERLGRLVAQWRTRYPDINLWSVQDAVEGLQDHQTLELAEALEFLPPINETGKLIDGRRSELVVKLGIPPARLESAGKGLDFELWASEAKAALPGVTMGWSGGLYRNVLGMEAFLWGELQGLAGFYVITFLMISLRLRSWKRGALAVFPALATGGFFLGLSGWLQWPISPATALVIAACLGQSADDGLLWSLLPPSQEVRSALAETTILLSAGLSILFFSSFANMSQAGLLVILSLCFSTAMVLWFLPWRLRV